MESDADAPQTLPITRAAYETLLRRLVVNGKPNVKFVTGTVTGYGTRVGDKLERVRLRTAQGESMMTGHFLVDATGPSQLSFHKWLKNAGFPVPSSIKVQYDSPVAYSQSIWTIPTHLHAVLDNIVPSGFKPGLLYGHSADTSKGEKISFGILLMEDAQLIIMPLQLGAAFQINSVPALRDFISGLLLPVPGWIVDLLDILEQNEVACAPWYWHGKSVECSYVKYHEVVGKDALPRNWVAIGDAAMKLNHHYGLGVGKSMVDAVTLDSVLRATSPSALDSSNLSEQFFGKAALRTKSMWETTKASDYGTDATTPATGETLAEGSFSRAFGEQLLSTASKDPGVYSVWWNVNMLLAPETDLLSPMLLVKVAKNWLMG